MCIVLQHVCLFHLLLYPGEVSMSGVPKLRASLTHFSEELTLDWSQEGSGGGLLPKHIWFMPSPTSPHIPGQWYHHFLRLVLCFVTLFKIYFHDLVSLGILLCCHFNET